MPSIVPLPSDKFLLSKHRDLAGRERFEPRALQGRREDLSCSHARGWGALPGRRVPEHNSTGLISCLVASSA